MWIGVQLLGGGRPGEAASAEFGTLALAIRAILLADVVMSMDNVIAVAALAQGSMLLVMLGLAISIPLVTTGAMLIVNLIARYPVIVYLGAGLIGWVAGETIIDDRVIAELVSSTWGPPLAAPMGLLFVLGGGWLLHSRRRTGSAGHGRGRP